MPIKKDTAEVLLMEGFRAASECCFTQLFMKLYKPLCYNAFRYTNNYFVAEDIATEAFMKIWERKHMFYDIRVLKSYLYTIVRNDCLQWIKQEAFIARNIPDSIIDEPDIYRFEDIISGELFANIIDLLEKLSPQGRRVMHSIFFKGNKIWETAEELGVSVSTVKTQKARALKRMRAELSGLEGYSDL